MSATALELITQALNVLNVILPGESLPTPQANRALSFLNNMVGSWAQQSLMAPVVSREVFDIVANDGEYTIGAGANFNTVRPANQSSLVGAGLLLNSSSPVVEIPRSVLTDEAWQGISVKGLTNALFTSVYYNPTFATSGFGTISLWPIPTTADNDLVLYIQKALASFADLSSTSYYFPAGYEEALVYNLARRLAAPWGGTLADDDKQIAIESKKVIMRMNLKLVDLANDFARNPQGGYNIDTGQ